MLRHDQPIVIVVADMAEQVAALAQAVEPMMDTGLMAVSDVEMIRLQGRDGAAVL